MQGSTTDLLAAKPRYSQYQSQGLSSVKVPEFPAALADKKAQAAQV
jgi:hypothetical protein